MNLFKKVRNKALDIYGERIVRPREQLKDYWKKYPKSKKEQGLRSMIGQVRINAKAEYKETKKRFSKGIKRQGKNIRKGFARSKELNKRVSIRKLTPY